MPRADALICTAVLWATGCPAPGEAELTEGNRLAQQGDLKAAAARYRAAGQGNQRARPRELLGMALHELGQVDEARTAWLEALRLEPDAPDAQLGLARIDLERSQLTSALDRLDRLIERQPARGDARVVRAMVLLHRNAAGDAERAVNDCDLALRASPSDADAQYVRGTALLASQKTTQARGAFEALRSQRPHLAAWGLARVAAAQSRNIDVIVHLREARQAIDAGWVGARVREDPAFRYLWDDPEFSREF